MKKLYENLNKKVFWLTLVISLVLIASSFILPPTGVIDTSVLAAVGELFGFATLGTVISAIEKGSDIKLSKGDINIEIDNPDEKGGEQ